MRDDQTQTDSEVTEKPVETPAPAEKPEGDAEQA